MDPIAVPEAAKAGRPECELVSMGPPAGVSDEDCGTVEMLRAPIGSGPLGVGRPQYAYFRPSPTELRQLADGGFIEFVQYGTRVQPFGAAVWPAAGDPNTAVFTVTDEMVEAFGVAWEATPASEPGARRRAGLAAALATMFEGGQE